MSKSTPKQKAKTAKAKAAKTSVKKVAPKTPPKAVLKPKLTKTSKTLAKPKTLASVSAPKKSVIASKKTAKSTVKAPVATSKPAKKPTAKKPMAKPSKPTKPAAKTIKTAKAAPAKTPSNIKDLYASIKSLESRMKRADTLTRKSVKALETAVTALDQRSRKTRSTDKGTLTRKVNQLSNKLTEMVTATQNSVNSELKTALANPSVENLNAALSRADQRLSNAESMQASAIAKINRHLAAIATTVDARIAAAEDARKAEIQALKTETITKIDTIEQDTASALGNLGDKIVHLSDEIKRRGEASELSIREKVSEIAAQTQSEFEGYRSGLESRIQSVETVDPGETRRLERTIVSLMSRVEELEHSLSQTQMSSAATNFMPAPAVPSASVTSAPVTPTPDPITQQPPKLSVVETRPVTATMADAFTPTPQPSQNIPPNPYQQAQEVKSEPDPLPPQDSHIPREFDPRQFMRETGGGVPQSQPVIAQPQPVAPQIADLAPQSVPIEPPMPAPTPAPIADLPKPDLITDFAPEPYANPAYAEQDDTMADVRIGEPETGFKPPKISGRNLRVAAMATGVAILGLVGAKTVLGGSDTDTQTPQYTQTDTSGTFPPQSTIEPPAANTIEPIGNYADNKPTVVTGEAAKTLNSAAGAGDAVAQFQLGLSYLEQGRTNEGVDLVRKSANQNQPAAQYRLAKLYEIGEGVTQDAELARQLTERAARNGNRIAMHDLALYYAEGRGGVKADLPTAAKWFEKAAERGVVDSQFNLGVLFESGQGLPKNLTDAFVWYSIAATQGDQFAKQRVAVLTDSMDKGDLATAAERIGKFAPVKIDEAANGIFRNVAWAKPDNAAETQVTQVKDVQTLLNDLGYDIGGADGSMGPRTRAAIISFEQANGMPETGRVNAALIDRLELAAGA